MEKVLYCLFKQLCVSEKVGLHWAFYLVCSIAREQELNVLKTSTFALRCPHTFAIHFSTLLFMVWSIEVWVVNACKLVQLHHSKLSLCCLNITFLSKHEPRIPHTTTSTGTCATNKLTYDTEAHSNQTLAHGRKLVINEKHLSTAIVTRHLYTLTCTRTHYQQLVQ